MNLLISEKLKSIHRYRIGKWSNESKWKEKVCNQAIKWTNKMPVVRTYGHRKNDTVQLWQSAFLIMGLQDIATTAARQAIEQWKKQIIDEDGNWLKFSRRVDFSTVGYALLRSAEQADDFKNAADQIIDVINENKGKNGLISYSQGKNSNTLFVDTLGMVCPFLALYGSVYHDAVAETIAFQQIKEYRLIGFYPGTVLPCHAINIELNLPLGVFGWGRGTAWYIISLIDSYPYMQNEIFKKEMLYWIEEAAEYYLQFQKENGGFETILQGGGQYDSSVTAVMAYFYKFCFQLFGKENYRVASDKCIKIIQSFTMRDGAIDQSQGDTYGIGVFSTDFDIMPFTQGMALRAISSIL